MTTGSRPGPADLTLVSRVIDYEPPPVGAAACRAPVTVRRRPARGRRPLLHPPARDTPPEAALVFADAALRRVLEVVDRRRPVAQLRRLLAPSVLDTVVALAESSQSKSATLRRIRLRMVAEDQAEVFGTYTRGPRVHALAGRIARTDDRWTLAALHLG